MILDTIAPENLDLAKQHQEGRVTEDVTFVTFTEGWFRELLKLTADNQRREQDKAFMVKR